MAYIVLALGAFLSIGGALSIFHGAGIVEVERGWTGVIAGATALTGGIITIALGLILKTLLDYRPVFDGRSALPASPADITAAHDRDSSQEALIDPVGESTSLMTAELENDMLAAMLAPTEPELEAERPFGAPAERPRTRQRPVAPVLEPSRRDNQQLHQASSLFEREAETDTAATVSEEREPVLERSRFKVGFKRQQPASPPTESASVDSETSNAPPMDDWLDRAFSALDNEAPLGLPVSHQPHSDEASVSDEPTATHLEAETGVIEATTEAQPDATPADAPPARVEPPPPASAVIGRYEADGTSYVMYADGSIEAQSDAGVYRFSSMTELKAFIESAEP